MKIEIMDTALDMVMEESEAGDGITVRQYFSTLLQMVWQEEEMFNGKRPFGNSGWGNEVFDALIKCGYMTDEDDFVAKVSDLVQYMCCGASE